MAKGTCLTCEGPIPDIWSKDVAILEYAPPMTVGRTKVVHLRCVKDPHSLKPEHLGRWAITQFEYLKEENHKLRKEMEMVHRALHNLPAELTEAYMNEAYDLGATP